MLLVIQTAGAVQRSYVNKCLLMVLKQLILCRNRNAISRRLLLKQMWVCAQKTLPDLEENYCETCGTSDSYSSINATTSLTILTFTNNSRLIILHTAQT